MDGHNSHHTVELLEYAVAHNIIILAYPPHCTHALQGQDVVVFSTFKNYYTSEFQCWEQEHGEKVTKYNFLSLITRPFEKTFTESTILAAWRATGLIPFNPSVITKDMMTPAEPKAITGGPPLPQPSPVKAMLAAWASSPLRSNNIDPHLLETPARRAHISNRLLEGTSAAFLIGNRELTSEDTLATPLFRRPPQLSISPTQLPQTSQLRSQDLPKVISENHHLRKKIAILSSQLRESRDTIQADQMQLALQHRYCDLLNKQLRRKENKKKPNRTKVFPNGQGRLLTSAEVIELVRASDIAAEQRKAGIATRKTERASKAEIKAHQKWVTTKKRAAYEAVIIFWNRTCQRLQEQGFAKKEWPSKPLYPFRKKSEALRAIEARLILNDGRLNSSEETGRTLASEPEAYGEMIEGVGVNLDEESDEESDSDS